MILKNIRDVCSLLLTKRMFNDASYVLDKRLFTLMINDQWHSLKFDDFGYFGFFGNKLLLLFCCWLSWNFCNKLIAILCTCTISSMPFYITKNIIEVLLHYNLLKTNYFNLSTLFISRLVKNYRCTFEIQRRLLLISY